LKLILYRAICGFVIGIGAVLPGVSGGILAISLGIYEKAMLAIGTLFRKFKENFKYLLPILIGGGVGVLLTSNVLNMLVSRYVGQLLSLFTGLVLGSLPELYREVRRDVPKLGWKHILAALLGLVFVLAFAFGESSVSPNSQAASLTIPGALAAGAVLSVGTVIPGVSSSFILVYMGLYPAVISTIASVFDLSALASSGFGAVIGRLGETILPLLALTASFALVSLLIIKIVNRMLARHHATAYAAVIGFVVGSVALVVPRIAGTITWAYPVFFAAGLTLSYLEFRFKEKLAGRKSAPAPVAGTTPIQANLEDKQK
jgi:putative membrane protein